MVDLVYTNLRPEHVPQLTQLELTCFPNADPTELLGDVEWGAYAGTFPEGVFVVLDGPAVVGAGAGILLDFDFDDPQHSIVGITGENQCGNHDPEGAWYYGTDITVHPEYRRRGIGRRLYDMRKELVQRLGKRGIIAGGHIPGFAEHKATMSAADYVGKVVAGELYDSTLSFQIENGFEVRGVLADYMHDEGTDGWSALIVWENPQYEQ
ncbi:MAG TPA: GNAT family N-acetyltransferase [Acidimicrobiia bacterium]|jgi:GNAT superfamily N-acetyltransferase